MADKKPTVEELEKELAAMKTAKEEAEATSAKLEEDAIELRAKAAASAAVANIGKTAPGQGKLTSAPENPGPRKLYVLRTGYWNGKALVPAGGKAYFNEGMQPKGSKLAKKQISEEEAKAAEDDDE